MKNIPSMVWAWPEIWPVTRAVKLDGLGKKVYGCQPKNRGILPPKWMVKIMETTIKTDDLEVPLFLETPI